MPSSSNPSPIKTKQTEYSIYQNALDLSNNPDQLSEIKLNLYNHLINFKNEKMEKSFIKNKNENNNIIELQQKSGIILKK